MLRAGYTANWPCRGKYGDHSPEKRNAKGSIIGTSDTRRNTTGSAEIRSQGSSAGIWQRVWISRRLGEQRVPGLATVRLPPLADSVEFPLAGPPMPHTLIGARSLTVLPFSRMSWTVR